MKGHGGRRLRHLLLGVWHNTGRITEPLGYLSAAEYEAQYLRTQSSDLVEVGLN